MRRILILAATTVALTDILSVVAVQMVGFHFGWRGPVLLVIYALAGYCAGRVGGLRAAMLVGSMSASVDSIAAVLWAIGSGRLPDQYSVPSLILIAILIPVFAALVGALGGSFAPRPRRHAAA